MLTVIKRDGRVEPLDITKIQKYTKDAVLGLKNVSQSELEVDAKIQFRDKITTEEIQQTIIQTAVSKIDVDAPDWTYVGARLFLYDLYHRVTGFTGYSHLRDYLNRGEEEGRIAKGFKEKYDLDELNSYIKPERDLQFTYLGIKTLYDRYLIKDRENRPIELPQQMFMAIAMFLAQNENSPMQWAKEFYDLISKFEVMLATPTLSNARTPRHQLSSCYIGSTPDNIEGIFDAYKEMALLSKFGGGIGWDYSKVRGIGSFIDGHKSAAGGVIPFLKITNDIAVAVDQLGCVDRDSFVKVLGKVVTDNFTHDFRREYIKCDFSKKELIEAVASYASGFGFEYGKFSANFIRSLIFDYVINTKDYKFLENVYGLSHDQYKKIISKYKKLNKGLPEGFETLIDYPNYAISQDGVVINIDSLKPLSTIIDRKGYVRVAIDKNSEALHLLLAKQYLNYVEGMTIDHIDGDKLNNSLLNLQIVSNEVNISKGWESSAKKRTEMSRIRKHLSYGYNLKGDRRDTHEFEIKDIEVLTIPIDEVRVGDLVLSYNIDEKRVEYKSVTSKYEIDVKMQEQIKISFDDGNFIITSNWHPFPKFLNEKLIYVRSDSLVVGDLSVNDKNETVKISQIEQIFEDMQENFYDLTVKGNNNYFCSTKNSDGNFHLIHNTRKGAIAVYLESWHIDILAFLDLKKNSGEERKRTHDLFPALWINDLFMKRLEEDGVWTLFDPYLVSDLTEVYGEEFEKKFIEYEKNESIPKERIKAKELWKKILVSYFETGSPFLCFKDSANRANPNNHSGIIRSSNLCVSGDTRLHTQYGLVKAKDLEENYGEILATYDFRTDGDAKNLGVGVAKALKMFKTKESADVYEVVTKDGYKIKSTMWHEYYIKRDKSIQKKKLQEIKVGDKLLIQSSKGQFGVDGDYDLGFLMGLVTGDGTFAINQEKNYSIAYVDLYNDDIALGEMVHKQIEKTIEKYYSLLPKAHKKEFKNIYPKEIQHSENSKKIRFSNIRLGRIFDEQFGFNAKTKLEVPETIFKGKEECVKGYLQGLFIADGTINKIANDGIPTFSIQLASISKKLLEDVQILLTNFGIRSKISKMRDESEEAFEYTTVDNIDKKYGSKALYRLNINGANATKFIYDIGFIGKKQIKALEIILERENLGYYESNKKEKFFVEIKEIKYIGKEDVYDTTQLLNHSLIFNGLVTGNCTEIMQNTEPNHYLIRLEFEDGDVALYNESDEVKTDLGVIKEAKKISALDSINGKRVFIVEKEKIDGMSAVCNLASVNLSKINSREDIERVVPTAIRMLDNVIDLNFYPLKKVKVTNLKTRAIGLGVMGEAQMLAENQIEWGSFDHFIKIDEIMEALSYSAISSSSKLAIEKGKYQLYDGSNWSKGIFPIDLANREALKVIDRGGLFGFNYDWDSLREEVKQNGMRNGYLMAIAPTSSISILVGTTQSVEPIFKKKWFENNLSGLIPVTAPNLNLDTWRYYTTAHEIDQKIIVKAGAIRQKWIDQAQSLNIFISLDKASGKYLHEIYTLAWRLGVKSTYYLRSESPEANKNEIADRSVECDSCQ